MGNKALADAVSAAATDVLEGTGSDKGTEGTGAKPEATGTKTEKTPDSTGASSEVQATTDQPKVDIEGFKAAWGVDLSVLPDEAAQEKFVTEWTETQKTIGKLQRDNAELRKVQPVEAPVVTSALPADSVLDVSKLTDDQIAEAIGVNISEADERDMRDIALTRTILEQQDRMDRLERGVVATANETKWSRALDGLEKDFGPLPAGTERAELIAWAAEQGVASPEAAYWAAVGPVRSAIASALNTRIIELRTDGKKAATTIRTKATAGVDETALESKNVKDAVKEAFEKARISLGYEISPG